MTQIIYGATLITSPTHEENFASRAIGKNSEAFTIGDTVGFSAADGLQVDLTKVIGIAQKTVTMASDNETVAKVTPSYVPIDQDYEFLMGTNADLSPLTSVGAYYGLTGTTGIIQVDVSSGVQTGGDRVVLCTGVDPNGVGGTGAGSGLRQGIFKFVEIYNFRDNA